MNTFLMSLCKSIQIEPVINHQLYISCERGGGSEGGETLAQVAQRGGRCPIPGNIQGQVGQVSEQRHLVEDVLAHCKEVGLDDL